ncbi:MAG: NAD-dependent deacylase [Planctomycetota bacterium]|jgi:NAD-dependent deacetylase|nr:NAD-dependent deacylase [Planctomycetota bacterium]
MDASDPQEALRRTVELLAGARNALALTGAGISVESGIPDFRGRGGLWERFDPQEYATIEAFRRDPPKVWRMLAELEEVVLGARPNPAHRALVELQEKEIVRWILTQNIDGLHQAAGSRNVIEYHGNGRTLVCLDCSHRVEHAQRGHQIPPPCPSCGAILKPDVILFGELIPQRALQQGREAVDTADLVLVIGTRAEVWPFAELPRIASSRGIPVVEINLERTGLSDSVADITLCGAAGELLPRLVSRLDSGGLRLGVSDFLE